MIKPMKAPTKPITDDEIKSLLISGPLIGSPKLDGFRGFVCPETNTLLSNSRKPYPNKHVQSVMSDKCYAGLDGEFIIGDPNDPMVFNNTSGPLRRHSGEPAFTFYIFDSMLDPEMPYDKRLASLEAYAYLPYIEVLDSIKLYTFEDVLTYEEQMLHAGYEGIMLRDPNGVYKFGRTTLRERNIFKRKPFDDAEAVIIAANEMMENCNEAFTDEMGRTKRSTCQNNLMGKNTLGSFDLKCDLWDNVFNCGTMMNVTQERRKEMWERRNELIGKTITFKYQRYGSIDAPRIPVFMRFRDDWDMSC